jgi:hypothetical protein
MPPPACEARAALFYTERKTMYQPQISQVANGLVRGWKDLISQREWTATDPTKDDLVAMQDSAAKYSVALQHIQDRTTYADQSTHRFQQRSLVDRQKLYLADTENQHSAVETALENE